MATADKLNKLIETKQAIKTAISNKGVEVIDTDTFASYASKIDSIQTGGFTFPDNTSFGYSNWDTIPNEVINYVNTGIYEGNVFNGVIIVTYPEGTVWTPYNSSSLFVNFSQKDNLSFNKCILDCSRLGSGYRKQLYNTFYNGKFKEIELRNTSNLTQYYNTFMGSISYPEKVTGIDMTSTSYWSGSIGENWGTYIEIKNLGYNANLKSFNVSRSVRLGMELEDHPLSIGATQALKDSLITNSFDRATAGYTTCTITLSSNTKALLTDDEIAQITAKGFTIA